VLTYYIKNEGKRVSEALRRVSKFNEDKQDNLCIKYDFDYQNEGVFIITDGKCIVINRKYNKKLYKNRGIKSMRLLQDQE